MSLADTGKAIGAVSQMLKEHLVNHPAVSADDITIGKVEPASSSSNSRSRINIFLYEILFDPHLREVSLDEGQPPPLWLVLKYLLTAFDTFGDSDSIEAHGFLGEGLRALQELSLLPLIGSVGPLNTIRALRDNPEPLKITFDQIPSDLLSKLMQGSDEKYRCSIGFEIRPVMIATSEPPSYSLLVGINYQDNNIVGETGIQIPVIPSLGPTIAEIIPTKIEPGTATITLRGNDLNLSGLAVQLGPIELPVTAQTPDSLQCQVNENILDGRAISAGSHPVSAVQILPTGRRRSSNLLVVDILPILDSATVSSISRVDPANLNSNVFGTIDLTGSLLGREQDDTFLALYRDGKTFKVFDNLTIVPSSPPPSPPPLQKQFQLVMQSTQAIPPGLYRVILRVNGQQAKRSPTIDLRVP